MPSVWKQWLIFLTLTLAWDQYHCLCYITLLCTSCSFPHSKIILTLILFFCSEAFSCTSACLMNHLAFCRFAVFSTEARCSVRVLWRPVPADHMSANSRWQWPRSAQTSRCGAFHWTWGLGVSCSSSPQRPSLLSLWVITYTHSHNIKHTELHESLFSYTYVVLYFI